MDTTFQIFHRAWLDVYFVITTATVLVVDDDGV